MRTFICIELPNDVQRALAALQNELRAVRADVSWPKPETFHLTLKFLGEVEERRLDEIKRACDAAADSSHVLSLCLAGIGMLPHRSRPRVIYSAVEGQVSELGELRRTLEEKLAALGFEREARGFKPHITLGRVKSPQRVRELVALCLAKRFATDEFAASEVVLMRSELRPEGARYTPLHRTALPH